MHPDTDWRPLLEGDLAKRAQEAILAIEASLRGQEGLSFTLSGGDAGLALFYGYLALAREQEEEQASWSIREPSSVAEERIERAIDALSESPTPPSLYSGFTGVAFATQLLWGSSDEEDDANEEIDLLLEEHLSLRPWGGHFDLINGLVGFGVYALARLPRPAARSCLLHILSHLEETAERHPEGLAFGTDPSWMLPERAALYPEGSYDLGLAHGLPGVIALLGRMCGAGVEEERARRLLRDASSWLLSKKHAGGTACFASILPKGVDNEPPSRSAWCYGDPGVAAAFLVAARAAKEPSLEAEAREIALLMAARPPEETGVKDAMLCHGAAGLAHIFNRLYQATGEEALGEAARSWFSRTLDFQRPGEGIGGFFSWGMQGGEWLWEESGGVLTGSAGVALALLAALSPIEPAWDQMLLISPC